MDIEIRRLIDMLPKRSAESFRAWLNALAFVGMPGPVVSGLGKSGGAGMALRPCSWDPGRLPPAPLVRGPLMGTCSLIVDA